MKLEISAQHKALIESVIRQNPKFSGNSDILDLVCESVYKKSYLLIDSIKDSTRIKKHLALVCDECLVKILKDKGIEINEVDSTADSKHTNEDDEITNLKKRGVLDEDTIEKDLSLARVQKSIVNLREEIQKTQDYSTIDNLIDPLEFCPPKIISAATINKLLSIIKKLSDMYPTRKYYEIFYLRYVKKLNHVNIAHELKISQVELSRRFIEMIKLTRESI